MKKSMLLGLSLLSMLAMGSFSSYAKDRTVERLHLTVKQNVEYGKKASNLNLRFDKNAKNYDLNVYSTDGSKYRIDEAKISSNADSYIYSGDNIDLELTLVPQNDGTDSWYFDKSYSESDIKLSGAKLDYLSRRDGKLILGLDIDSVKGVYQAPDGLSWDADDDKLIAEWNEVEEGSRYNVELLRNENVLYSAETTATSYDFTGNVTESGNYKFRVRVLSTGNDVKSSSFVTSEGVRVRAKDTGRYIQNSNGPSPNGNGSVKAGWIADGSRWKYRYPNGVYRTNGWEKINNIWYRFDNAGYMVTGWSYVNNNWYLFNNDGAMLKGFANVGNQSYYLLESGDYEGACVLNKWIKINGDWYYASASGALAKGWYQVNGGWYYFYDNGKMAHDVTVDSFVIGSDGRWVH